MIKKNKKLLTLLLILAMSISLLAGCAATPAAAPDATPAAEPAEPAAEEPAEEEPAEEPVEVTELSFWHIQTQDIPKKIIDDAIARFEAANPMYDVTVEPMQNDAYKTKLAVALGADTMPDIFPHWSGGPMISYIDAGKVAEITALMNQDGFVDRFLPAGIAQATYQDKIWAVPVENIAVAMFFYNKEVFAANNIEIPTTIAELEAVAETLKANGVIPFSLANKTKWTGSMYYMYLVDRIGGADVFANAANRQNNGTFLDPAFTRAGTIIQDWVNRDFFNEGFNGLDEDSGQSRALLYAGRAAMTLMGSWIVSTINSENPDFLPNLGVFPFPIYEGGKGDPSGVVGTVGDNFYSVAASSKSVEGSFAAIQSLLDEQSVIDRIAAGKIPPLVGVQVADPMMQNVLNLVNQAKTTQLWYDQYLPPIMGDLHKDTSQEIFGLTKTPEEVNAIMEAKAVELAK